MEPFTLLPAPQTAISLQPTRAPDSPSPGPVTVLPTRTGPVASRDLRAGQSDPGPPAAESWFKGRLVPPARRSSRC